MDFSTRIPAYLVTKKNTVKLIVFTALFSLTFINIYLPYDSTHWMPGLNDLKYFLLSSALVLIGMAVVAISRIIMYNLYGRKTSSFKRPTLGYYLLWIAAEILAMSFTFTLVGIVLLQSNLDIIGRFKVSLWNTSLVLLLPYSVLWLYFSWDDKNKRLEKLALGEVEHGADSTKDKLVMTKFYDSKGEIKFSVKLSDLMYIKGADNYITIYYKDGEKLSSMLIRNTMKQAEADLRPQGIIRCHKSYMVNSLHIKLLEKKNDGLIVKLDAPMPLNIPVTKSYVKDVYELL